MENLDKSLTVTKAQKFWIPMKKKLHCESGVCVHKTWKDLEPSDWDH